MKLSYIENRSVIWLVAQPIYIYLPYDHTSDLEEKSSSLRTSGADHLIGKNDFRGFRSEVNIGREKSVTFTTLCSSTRQLRAACNYIGRGALIITHIKFCGGKNKCTRSLWMIPLTSRNLMAEQIWMAILRRTSWFCTSCGCCRR